MPVDPLHAGSNARRSLHALNELAEASKVGVRVNESSLPLKAEVKAACEMLGLDPLYVANEGKLIAVVPPADAQRVLAAMRSHPLGHHATIIGEVVVITRAWWL